MADVSINLNDLDELKRLTESSSRVQIVAAQPKTLSHLPQRPAVDLAFVNLNYRVKEGRSHSKLISTIIFIYIVLVLLKKKISHSTHESTHMRD
jgi:hypothetical protein